MDEDTNRVNEAWFRDRLERDGYERGSADPPPAARLETRRIDHGGRARKIREQKILVNFMETFE